LRPFALALLDTWSSRVSCCWKERTMYTRMTVTFAEEERKALQAMAERDFRYPKEQLRYLLRAEAERRGLLPATEQPRTETKETADAVSNA
jgi:hypothetical protein